ncbi:hypothetical protein [Mesonia sp. HuA40]|uniref:hypothetical protein n=1 Tax=Mesonia sp. HuA40 TaxID=2602761 RepID=UPI0011C7344F|nr:hypothetical protein [Mesonia sp. HuA40]TXK74039.1 hypothetical protein FT993_03120 [Mesonia sp. HuA40]
MKNTLRKTTAVLAFAILSLTSFEAAAQFPGFDDDVDDETPAAPIDGLVALGFIAGGYLGFRKLRK